MMSPISNTEIQSLETQLGSPIPGLYRKLLGEIGHGSFGQQATASHNTSLIIYHPLEIADLYGYHFDDPALLFGTYFPFGCNNETQELWIIDVTHEKAASIWHETHPEDYPNEGWLPYEDWVVRYLPA